MTAPKITAPMPSIPQAVALVYRDLRGVVDAMPRLAIMALALVISVDVAEELLMPRARAATLALPLLIFVFGLAQTLILTPYLIAVHRFVILGETTPGYVFAPRDPRNQLYFLWWATFSVMAVAPVFLPVPSASAETSVRMVGPLLLVYFFLVMIAGLRLTTLFPAIAIDAPDANWRAALAASKGNVWRIFLVCLMALLPVMVAGALAQRLSDLAPTMFATLVLSIFEGAIAVVTMTLFAVISSRLYQWLRPPAPPAR